MKYHAAFSSRDTLLFWQGNATSAQVSGPIDSPVALIGESDEFWALQSRRRMVSRVYIILSVALCDRDIDVLRVRVSSFDSLPLHIRSNASPFK